MMTKELYYATFDSRIGELLLAKTHKGLCLVDNASIEETINRSWFKKYFSDYELIEDASQFEKEWGEIKEYIEGERQSFTLTLDLYGTAFQQSVWRVLQSIPYGQTFSYGEVARMIGKRPNVAQAVGQAVGENPIMIIIPCHRVVSQTGELTGFRGGLDLKAKLLDLEGTEYK